VATRRWQISVAYITKYGRENKLIIKRIAEILYQCRAGEKAESITIVSSIQNGHIMLEISQMHGSESRNQNKAQSGGVK
jgi:hypothetical protein